MINQKTYVGRPCKYGHSGLRYKINRSCVKCDRVRAKANIDYYREYTRYWRSVILDDPIRAAVYRAQGVERCRKWRNSSKGLHYQKRNVLTAYLVLYPEQAAREWSGGRVKEVRNE